MLAVATTDGGASGTAHDTGPGHPERPSRLAAALDGIVDAGLSEAVLRLAPRRARLEELSQVHDPGYLHKLERFCAAGGGAIDADTIVGPGSYEAALLGAGAVLAVVDALREGTAEVGFVAARPPGHHATSRQGMGFCLVNHVAVAAASLVASGERVAVVDWDVHHGNGTQQIFWDDPQVLYVSTHQMPLYPGSGALTERGGPGALGTTVNVPVPPGATGDVLAMAFDEVVAPVLERFAPTWVLVSAGFDAHRADPLADLQLSAGDFAVLATKVSQLAPRSGRLVLVLEGGYDLDALRGSVGATLAATMGSTYRPEPATTGGPGRSAVAEARSVHLAEAS